MSQEIAPCPFCGRTTPGIIQTDSGYRVFCLADGCETKGPIQESVREAKEAWNRRAPCPDCRRTRAETWREVSRYIGQLEAEVSKLPRKEIVALAGLIKAMSKQMTAALSPAPASEPWTKPQIEEHIYVQVPRGHEGIPARPASEEGKAKP